MVSYVRNPQKAGRIKDIDLFIEVVNLFLNHRRKMLKACTKLAAGRLAQIENWDEIFATAKVNPTNRPEQITPVDYIAIANNCYQKLFL
jgi:16S rRNA A1518/A1519 N6-dimethyltransferase RsmA/KsgA/DIM1 with predicted DNA glycosylase/AP lyase activity